MTLPVLKKLEAAAGLKTSGSATAELTQAEQTWQDPTEQGNYSTPVHRRRCGDCSRDWFQISPHPWHRQYVASVTDLLVVDT
jgi:hypothetical protein